MKEGKSWKEEQKPKDCRRSPPFLVLGVFLLLGGVLGDRARAADQVTDECVANPTLIAPGQTTIVTCTANYSGRCEGQDTTNMAQVDAGTIGCDQQCPNETCQTPNPPGQAVGYFVFPSPATCVTSFKVTAPAFGSGTIHFLDNINTANGCHVDFTLDIPFGIVCPKISVAPDTLPGGTAGSPYSAKLTASGGLAPYKFDTSRGSLPAGLTLDESGAITGAAHNPGTYTFSVQATDSNGCKSDSEPVAITIAPANGPDLTPMFSQSYYVQRPNDPNRPDLAELVDLDVFVENVGSTKSSGGGELLMDLPETPPNGYVFIAGASGCQVTDIHNPQHIVCQGINALDPGADEHFHIRMNAQSKIPSGSVISLFARVHEADDINSSNDVSEPAVPYAVSERNCTRKDVELLQRTGGRHK